MTVALLCILMIIKKVAFAADTCCYGPRCPAATFVDTSGDLYGFTFTDGQEITSGSATEQALAISVSSCCPDGGNVYAHWNGDTSVENMCRCGTETTWITQSSCINSFGYQGCAPTSSPTAEQCPDISPYQVTGNSYSQNGIAYCNIGTDFNIPPTISSEQRCDIELDGTYSRAATDVAYSWPLYIKDDNANIQIQRAVESSAARSLWAGVNNGDIEWAALITNCGTQPYDILNCGYEIAGNIQDDAGEFGAATIRANCITTPAPTTTTTQQPTDSPISPAPTTNLPTGVPTTDYPTYGESTTPAPISDNNSSNGAFSLKDTIQFVSFFVLFILFSIIV